MALGLVLAGLASTLTACGNRPAATPPPVTYLPGAGGTVTVGIDQKPTGCNPSTATGDTFANRLVLSTVLPSAFAVDGQGQSQYDQALIEQAETVSTNPQTVVYTLNPKAVWSDGTPITAADFVYAWERQRLVPVNATGEDADVASTAGYDDIQTVVPSDGGHTVTVVFSTPYADWQGLFSDLV
ncbi:MAG: ABC transporter substrate-binding protein, partial [Acidimicrobiales bacterium]